MNQKQIDNLVNLSKLAKDFLKEKLLLEYQKKDSDKSKLSFRNLEKITGLNSKQLQRIIHEDKFPHFDSLIKAIQVILGNSSKPSNPKKRRE